jgi:crotonobetainyl-CoA:carnitine CoA-transferase CaiB-like acyl-CoA transferase
MYVGTWAASAGYEPKRMPESAHPSIVPFQAFRTADGYITVACAKQKFWERFAAAVGHSELLDDPRFADFATRNEHRDELLPTLRQALATACTEEWIDRLSAAGVPCGPVYEVPEALRDRHAVARGDVVAIEHPHLGLVRQVASPLRMSSHDESTPTVRRAPFRGEHTEEILRAVRDTRCGLIAMGTHGHRPLRRMVAGSLTDQVVRRSPVPVLVRCVRRAAGPGLVPPELQGVGGRGGT